MCLAGVGTSGAHVALIYPTGGETLAAGSRVTIEWQEVILHNGLNWDLYWSSDGGSTWTPIQLDVPYSARLYEWDVPLVATTMGRVRVIQDNADTDYQAVSGDLVVEVVGTAVEGAPGLPAEPLLVSGWPNPFAGSVEISVGLPRAGQTRVDVYDVRGILVARLADRDLQPGIHRFTWSADRFPPGVYLARVSQQGRVTTKALVLGR